MLYRRQKLTIHLDLPHKPPKYRRTNRNRCLSPSKKATRALLFLFSVKKTKMQFRSFVSANRAALKMKMFYKPLSQSSQLVTLNLLQTCICVFGDISAQTRDFGSFFWDKECFFFCLSKNTSARAAHSGVCRSNRSGVRMRVGSSALRTSS